MYSRDSLTPTYCALHWRRPGFRQNPTERKGNISVKQTNRPYPASWARVRRDRRVRWCFSGNQTCNVITYICETDHRGAGPSSRILLPVPGCTNQTNKAIKWDNQLHRCPKFGHMRRNPTQPIYLQGNGNDWANWNDGLINGGSLSKELATNLAAYSHIDRNQRNSRGRGCFFGILALKAHLAVHRL